MADSFSSPGRSQESPETASSPDHTGSTTWLGRYRRFLPGPIALVLLFVFRPKASGYPVDVTLRTIGFFLCASGQWLRLWAWGSNAVVRDTGVRDRGPYALMSHPLYAGNVLIAAGIAVVYNNFVAYLLLIAPFAVAYSVITRSEEKYMMETFPSDYQRYKARRLPRFFPALRNLCSAAQTTLPFGWRFAWRKEYPSCCAWVAGLSGLELYKEVLAHGWERSWTHNWLWVAVMLICAAIMLASLFRKRHRGA